MVRDSQVRPTLLQSYRLFLEEQNRSAFIVAVSQRYTEGTLQRLYWMGDRVTRRAAILALGSLGTRHSSGTLGAALQDVDRGVRMVAEDGLKALWVRAAGPPAMYAVSRLMRLNAGQLYDIAADGAEELIAEYPLFAEAYHQLGVACMGVADYERAQVALERCFDLEPQHFVAAQRLARVLVTVGDPFAALQRLGDTLEIYPSLEPARLQLEQLRRSWNP